jgi:DNA-binding NarL/FixJ family response regulator
VTAAKTAKRKKSRRGAGGSLEWLKTPRLPVVSVLIADSSKAIRTACARILQSMRGIRLVGEATTGLQAVSATAKLRPRVALVDLELSSEFGPTLISILRRKSPRTRVILLVGRASEARVLEALSHGAVGALSKKDLRFLPEALEAVASGEAWMSRKMIPKIMDRLAAYIARAEAQR